MKEHAIIPIFIPHRGCPNDCVFCNQHSITARTDDVSPEDARGIIDTWLTTLREERSDERIGERSAEGFDAARSEQEHEESAPGKGREPQDQEREESALGKGRELQDADISEACKGSAKRTAGAERNVVEIAFYGGSFTGLPIEEQSAFLEVAKEYKDSGLVDKIHLSTRPDYIDREILDNLKKYGVDVIELGVQSFDDEVLRLSNRGHSAQVVYEAAGLIKDYGFELGIQLMIGLPGDSRESCAMSARETAALRPGLARLYPTVVLDDTELCEMYRRGEYAPLSQEEAVSRTLEMYEILVDAGITIMRIGLKSTDLINDMGIDARLEDDATANGEEHYLSQHQKERKKHSTRSAARSEAKASAISTGTYHPAFRQLVEGAYAREKLEAMIGEVLSGREDASLAETDSASSPVDYTTITISANSKWFSNLIGHKAENKKYFEERYTKIHIKYTVNNDLPDRIFVVK